MKMVSPVSSLITKQIGGKFSRVRLFLKKKETLDNGTQSRGLLIPRQSYPAGKLQLGLQIIPATGAH